MRTSWTKTEIESILIQLNKRLLPFKKYGFSHNKDGLVLLGSGGFSNVYEMQLYNNTKKKYAVKVLGFGEKHVDSDEFRNNVNLQKKLMEQQANVVGVIDFIELRVYIDDNNTICDVAEVKVKDEKNPNGRFLNLQFILMEKLVPVLVTDKKGSLVLCNKKLAKFEEKEILKLAYNIGTALAKAHEMNLLHRDVKLENVFYDPVKDIYKLGDFGIAKMIDDAMASTIAFTNGYGAPEVVGSIDEKYDNTADVYSFGVMLYLLLNELKFPNSNNYNVNRAVQYTRGYQFPISKHDDYKLNEIIIDMCQYDPDDRYQSMETVVNDIEGIIVNEGFRFKKDDEITTYAVGFIFYALGMIVLKLTYMSNSVVTGGIWKYLFLLTSGVVFFQSLRKKKFYLKEFFVLVTGIGFFLSSNCMWGIIPISLGVLFSSGSFAGLIAVGGIAFDISDKLSQAYSEITLFAQQYKWMAIASLSFSMFLLFQHAVLKIRDIKIHRLYFNKNLYWILVFVSYFSTFFIGLNSGFFADFVEQQNLTMIGLVGMIYSAIWIVRETLLVKCK